MTLKITSNKIIVENQNGIEKFNSNNHLLYKQAYATGSVSLSGGTPSVNNNLGFTVSNTNIYSIYITMTNCSGSIGSSLIGVKIPLSGAMPIHWEGYVSGYNPAAKQENLEVMVDGNQLKAQTILYTPDNLAHPLSGVQSISFNYVVNVYAHQDIQ